MNDSQNKTYEFDVERYTIAELFNILKLNDKTKENIPEHMENMIITYSNNIKNNESNESTNQHKLFIYFLKQARRKILEYLNYSELDYSEQNMNTNYNIIRDQFNILENSGNNEPVQLKPTNYDIIHSKSIVDGGQHNITKKKIVPVVYTNDWKYPAGVINPIEKRFITKIINIDSLFRENYTTTLSSNFMWVLPENLNNVISMKITSIEIPYSWFVISEKTKNNKFTINLFNMSGQADITHTITIPDGNYLAETFVEHLTNYFQNIGNGLQFLYATVNVDNARTIIRARINTDVGGFPSPYDPNDRLYSPNFYFTIDFVSEYETNFGKNFKKSLGWFLGFRKPLYIVTKDNTFNDNISNSYNQIVYKCYLSSESSYGSSIQNYFFLDLNDYNNNEITDSIVSSIDNAKNEYIGNNIIAKIPIVNPFFTTLFNNNANDKIFKQRDYLGPVRLNKLHIRLLNKFGDIIDLNGNDFSFTLEMSVLYQ
jgi:hypothetical protein